MGDDLNGVEPWSIGRRRPLMPVLPPPPRPTFPSLPRPRSPRPSCASLFFLLFLLLLLVLLLLLLWVVLGRHGHRPRAERRILRVLGLRPTSIVALGLPQPRGSLLPW